MTDKDHPFWDIFDYDTQKEFQAKGQEIERENRAKQIDNEIDPGLTEFYLKMGDAFYTLGISFDVDIANRVEIVHAIGHEDKVFDVIKLYVIDEFYDNKANAFGVASAITAGLLEPRFFKFWSREDDDD